VRITRRSANERSTAIRRSDLARIEATYGTPDVVEQRRIVRAAFGLKPGKTSSTSVRDQASWLSEMAEAVGPAGSVRVRPK